MARYARPARIVVTLLLARAVFAADPRPEDARAAYDQWRATYAAKSLEGNLLAITLIEERPRDEGPSIYTYGIKAEGQIWWTSSSSRGHKGGSGNMLSPEAIKRLRELAPQLPADTGRLPPPERRLLLQTPQATRVYDRAELAAAVAEFLRVSGCRIGAWMPTFKSQSHIDAGRYEHGGFLALSPDGKRLLFASSSTLQFWAPTTHETLGNLKMPSNFSDIAFSPDGSLAALAGDPCQILGTRTWKLLRKFSEPPHDQTYPSFHDPHFTPDGRCLVLRCGSDALRFFDTKTWERLDPIPEIPHETVQWKPAKSWQHAVLRTKTGVISLWDAKARTARELDPAAPLLDAAFSPDESQVALATADKDGYSNPRLRIFQTATGQLVHELRAAEVGCDRLRLPQWTPDGRYILAVTRPGSFYTSENISLWNAQTGRHRADFIDCPSTINGIVLLAAGDQLIAGCQDGRIRCWDFAAALQQITAFEKSLAPAPSSQPTTRDH